MLMEFQLVLKQLSPNLLRVITILGIRLQLYTKIYMFFLFPLAVSQNTRIKKKTESTCLDIKGLNKKQAWLLISDKTNKNILYI